MVTIESMAFLSRAFYARIGAYEFSDEYLLST